MGNSCFICFIRKKYVRVHNTYSSSSSSSLLKGIFFTNVATFMPIYAKYGVRLVKFYVCVGICRKYPIWALAELWYCYCARSLLKSLISLDLIVFPYAPEIHCGFSLNYWGTNFRLYRITKVSIFIISCSSMCGVDLITTGSIFILVIPEKSWREIKINCGYCASLTPSSAQNIRLTNDYFFLHCLS